MLKKRKTNSSVKKRIGITASGRFKSGFGYKRHKMSKRSSSKIRQTRGTKVLSSVESGLIAKILGF